MNITFNNYKEYLEVTDRLEKERITLETVELYNEMNSFISNNIIELSDSELYTEEVEKQKKSIFQKTWDVIISLFNKIFNWAQNTVNLVKNIASKSNKLTDLLATTKSKKDEWKKKINDLSIYEQNFFGLSGKIAKLTISNESLSEEILEINKKYETTIKDYSAFRKRMGDRETVQEKQFQEYERKIKEYEQTIRKLTKDKTDYSRKKDQLIDSIMKLIDDLIEFVKKSNVNVSDFSNVKLNDIIEKFNEDSTGLALNGKKKLFDLLKISLINLLIMKNDINDELRQHKKMIIDAIKSRKNHIKDMDNIIKSIKQKNISIISDNIPEPSSFNNNSNDNNYSEKTFDLILKLQDQAVKLNNKEMDTLKTIIKDYNVNVGELSVEIKNMFESITSKAINFDFKEIFNELSNIETRIKSSKNLASLYSLNKITVSVQTADNYVKKNKDLIKKIIDDFKKSSATISFNYISYLIQYFKTFFGSSRNSTKIIYNIGNTCMKIISISTYYDKMINKFKEYIKETIENYIKILG